jgi:hypothetical protein
MAVEDLPVKKALKHGFKNAFKKGVEVQIIDQRLSSTHKHLSSCFSIFS